MPPVHQIKCLIVDDEEDILDVLEYCILSAFPCEIIKAKNGFEAINLINQLNFDIIFCDFKMPEVTGGKVYEHLLSHASNAKYVMCSSDSPEQHSEFKDRSKFFAQVLKPDIVGGVAAVMDLFIKNRLSTSIPPNSYVPIAIGLLLKLDPLPVDLYIKITEEKFLKVFKIQSVFDEIDFVKYSQKGVFYLFTAQNENAQIFKAIDDKILKIKQNATDPVSQVMQIQEILVSTFRDYGMRPELQKEVEAQIKQTVKLCDQDKSAQMLLNKLLKNNGGYICRHSFMIASISTLVAKKLTWTSEVSQNKLVIASLMHDIFLNDQVQNETDLLLTKNYDQKFIEHARLASDLLETMPNIPLETSVIIREQHEIGADGIPEALGFLKVSPLGLLFSFSHFVVDSIIDLKTKNSLTEENLHLSMAAVGERNSTYRKCLVGLKSIQLFT